ncbi:MAG: PIN domain-containing protein [Acidimicrobiales bacterium]|nr:PIN domain-containing protein [Acidimicrobiales bacterium]
MLLLDTNILVAAADRSTPEYERCVAVLDSDTDLIVSTPVVVETAWMIESRLGPEAEAAFVNSVAAGELRVVDLSEADWTRCRDLITQYADLRLGLVDASVVVLAERFGLETIATLNHRDFAVVRPAHRDSLTLIP